MNKQEIVQLIHGKLHEEFESRSRVSKTKREGDNDAESKAEGGLFKCTFPKSGPCGTMAGFSPV